MATPVFLTTDTELAWRHHAAGLPVADIVDRSIDPAGVGIAYQLAKLAEHRLQGVFFVDPVPALTFGPEVVRRIVEPILAAGQDVQLHVHPNWVDATAGDRGATHARFELIDYAAPAQRDLIARATELLVAAGAPPPVAFRAGSYAANDATLAALAACGLRYDSSHNGAHAPWPSAIDLPRTQIAPVERRGLIEVPVTLIEERPGGLRPFQVCALSAGEMRAALDHAVAYDHAAVTIVSHSFELATRDGCRVQPLHRARFDALCRLLDERRDTLPTAHFAALPMLRLGQRDLPLGPARLRTRWRQAQQAWANLVERAA